MAMGMSRDDYWNNDVFLAFDYAEADKIRNQRRNRDMWTMGLYVQSALYSAIWHGFAEDKSNLPEYPEKPFPVYEDEMAEYEAEKAKKEAEYAEQYMNTLLEWGNTFNGDK